MWKGLKNTGFAVLGAVAVLAIALGIVWYVRGQQQDEPAVDDRIILASGRWKTVDRIFLCEWHYPSTNGVPKIVEVFYYNAGIIQCYRIEGDNVTDYHCVPVGGFWQEIEEAADFPPQRRDRDLVQRKKGLSPPPPYLNYEERWRIRAAWDFNEQVRPFEENGAGYAAVMAWEWIPLAPSLPSTLPQSRLNFDSSAAAVWPMGESPPAINALHGTVKVFMADPSTRESHASYLRGCPVLPPTHSVRIHRLRAWKDSSDFDNRQRYVLRFLPGMDRALIPIDEGVNPFKGFETPYAPGNSVTLNYRSKEKDFRWYLKGDNFWRVEVYGGERELVSQE
ncbi:MAG: hypothetical protein FWG50_08240 [Kiritimatiellaeota bacterium]|nr:hypothetical protein [Kiritimatiellota bacterium]